MKKINWFIIGLVGTFLVLFFLSFNKLPAGSYDMKFQSQLWQQEEATVTTRLATVPFRSESVAV